MELGSLDRSASTILDKEVVVTSLLLTSQVDVKPRSGDAVSRDILDEVVDEFVCLGVIDIDGDRGRVGGLDTILEIIRNLIALASSSSEVNIRRGNMEAIASILGRSSRGKSSHKSHDSSRLE